MSSRFVSVILPIYKTAQYLEELQRRLVVTLERLAVDFELILVDDGSPDRAWDIVRQLAANDPRVKGISLSRNFGQHPAICAGFEAARGDVIVLMDADLQDLPENVPLLLGHLKDDVDIVYTVKEGVHETLSTRLTSAIFHWVFSKITGTHVPRNIGTFRVFTRSFLDALLEFPERNILYGPLMFYVGFRAAIVPVPHEERRGSRGAYSFRKRLALALDSLLSYTDLPHRLLVGGGGMVFLFSILYAVVLVVRYLTASEPLPPGLTLLALLGTLSLGALMMAVGIVGIYIFRVYQEVLRRPRYLVARRLNFSEKNP